MKITTLFMFFALAALSFPTTSCVSEEVSNSIMLRSAARRNDWNEFTKLASTGAKMDPQEATKLLVRYAEGELPGAPSGLASALILAGADVNAKDGNGRSLLAVAVDRKNWRMFSALVSARAKMNAQEATELLALYSRRKLPGAPSGLATALVSMGADVNAKDEDGRSLLAVAVDREDWRMFSALVSAGAKMNAQEATDLLVLYAKGARSGSLSDVVPVLVSMGADVNAQDGNGHSLLYSAGIRDWRLFRKLASAGAKMNAQEATDLLVLCVEGKRSVISRAIASSLVSTGADVNAQDGNGHSLLAVAVDRKNWLMFSALVAAGAKMDPQEATKLLVRYAKGDIFRAPDGLASALVSMGADVNAKDEDGRSLLAVAVDRKNWRMFSALVSAGAKMNAQEATELLALYSRRKLPGAPSGLATALVSMGADVNAKDSKGHSLLYSVGARGDWIRFLTLISAGAKMSAPEATELLARRAKGQLLEVSSSIVSELVTMGADVNAKTDDGRSLLDLASARKDWVLFNDLASAGAKMSVEESTGLLLQYAKGELSGAPSDVVPVLVSMGADVNAKDGDGHSLLFIADSHKNREAVRALTAAGAKMTPEEKQGFRYSLMSSYIRTGEWRKIVEAVENKEIYLTDISPSSGQNAFHAVAQIDWDYDIDESFLVALKNAGVDINKKDAEGFSPLATAIRRQNEKAVAALLKYGANPSDSIPIQGAFGYAGEKKLMDYAIEIHNAGVEGLNEVIRLRKSMPISARTLDPEVFELGIQTANSVVGLQQARVKIAKTIVSLMARATGTEVSDM